MIVDDECLFHRQLIPNNRRWAVSVSTDKNEFLKLAVKLDIQLGSNCCTGNASHSSGLRFESNSYGTSFSELSVGSEQLLRKSNFASQEAPVRARPYHPPTTAHPIPDFFNPPLGKPDVPCHAFGSSNVNSCNLNIFFCFI